MLMAVGVLSPKRKICGQLVSGQLPRKMLSDIPGYPNYMITAAIARATEHTVKRRLKPLSFRKRDYLQLNINLCYGIKELWMVSMKFLLTQ